MSSRSSAKPLEKVSIRPGVSILSVLLHLNYTEVILDDLHTMTVKKTLSKIKEPLADIFRVFIRGRILELKLGDDVLTYQEPPILVAPYERDPAGGTKTWRKDINFDLGGG